MEKLSFGTFIKFFLIFMQDSGNKLLKNKDQIVRQGTRLSKSAAYIDLLEIGWTIQAPSPPCSSAGERVGVRRLTIQPIMHSLISRM
jgi:hypothetical protein